MRPLLELGNAPRVYAGGGWLRKREPVVALDHVSFSIADDRPSITAIAGESGSGKTTLGHLLLGHLTPSSGQVLYHGQDLATMSADERMQFRRAVQPLFQAPFAAFNRSYRMTHLLPHPLRRF